MGTPLLHTIRYYNKYDITNKEKIILNLENDKELKSKKETNNDSEETNNDSEETNNVSEETNNVSKETNNDQLCDLEELICNDPTFFS
jgi:hypothetical protein